MSRKLIRATIPMCTECGAECFIWEHSGAAYRCTACHALYDETFAHPDWGYIDQANERNRWLHTERDRLIQQLADIRTATQRWAWDSAALLAKAINETDGLRQQCERWERQAEKNGRELDAVEAAIAGHLDEAMESAGTADRVRMVVQSRVNECERCQEHQARANGHSLGREAALEQVRRLRRTMREVAGEMRRFAGDSDWEHQDGTPVDLRGLADRLDQQPSEPLCSDMDVCECGDRATRRTAGTAQCDKCRENEG